MISPEDPQTTYEREMRSEIRALAEELGVGEDCAADVCYLRTRSRWTPELENELVRLWGQGIRPNIYEFGVTRETQRNLMNAVSEELQSRKENHAHS